MPKVVKKSQPKKKATKPTSKDKKKKVLTKKTKKPAAKPKNKKEKKKAVAKEAAPQSNAENLVLTVPNRHVISCGEAPNITASDDAFVSYFMNQYGEQAVFIAEKLPRGNKIAARVWMGDCGWEKALPVQEKCFFLSNLD